MSQQSSGTLKLLVECHTLDVVVIVIVYVVHIWSVNDGHGLGLLVPAYIQATQVQLVQ